MSEEKTFILYSLADGSGILPHIVKGKDKIDVCVNYIMYNNGSIEDFLQLNDTSFEWAIRSIKEMEIVEIVEQSTKVPEEFINNIYAQRFHYSERIKTERDLAELKRLKSLYEQ